MPGLYSGLLKSNSFGIHDTWVWAGNHPKGFASVLWDSISLKKGVFWEGWWPFLECVKLNPLLSIDRHHRGYSSANPSSFQTLSLVTFCLEREGKEHNLETGVSWALGSKHLGPAFVPVISKSGQGACEQWELSPVRKTHSFLWLQDSKSRLCLLIICIKEKKVIVRE